jgi:flagellar hook-associated protein 2
MTLLLARYIKQFSVMDSLVGQTNSLRTSLSSTFTGMQSIYNNK